MLRRTANESFLLREIGDGQLQLVTPSSTEADTMWSVVDYSTMSNRSVEDLEQSQSHDTSVWPHSWMGLFGTMPDVNDPIFDMLDY
jgi:hypothetical protein